MLSILTLTAQTLAQQPQTSDARLLKINQPLTSSLKDSESHSYRLRLEAGQLARVLVMQQGVDVAVQALDGQKKRLARSEDSFGRVGPQLLEFVSETAGEYLIQVLARPRELGGNYEIKFLEARTASAADRTRQAAYRHVTEGNSFRSVTSPERMRSARVAYDKALALFKQISDKAGQATCLQYIGRLYEATDYRRALENYSAALKLWRDVRDRRGEGYATSNIGTMHLYIGNLDLAYVAFQEAVEIFREVANREGEALCYQEIGNIHRQQGDQARALSHFQQALNLFREVGAKARMLYALSNIGSAYQSLGDLNQASDYHQQSLAVGLELKQKHGISLAFINLGGIASEQGETRKALSLYQQALPLCLELGEWNCEARTYWRVAAVHHNLGETQTALDYYAKSVAIYRRQERPVELARMLNSSGALYSLLGDKKRALTFHEEALTLSRKAQSRQDEAESLSNLAELYSDQGDAQKARAFYEQALAISREIKNRLHEATALNRLGRLAQAAGEKKQAIQLFEQALAADEAIGRKGAASLTLHNLGVVYAEANDHARALDYFNKALAVLREIENKSGEALLLFRVASAQKKLNKIGEARTSVAAAIDIVETIRGHIVSPDLRSSYLATVQAYYDLYVELLMLEHEARSSENFNLLALQVSEQARSRSLLDLLREAKADVLQGTDVRLLARQKELLELINAKAASQAEAFTDPRKVSLAKSLGEEINQLSEEYETVQVRIKQSDPRYAGLTKTEAPSLPEMQSLVDAHTLLLEYRLGVDKSYLWVVGNDRFDSFKLPARTEIEALAREVYQLFVERNARPPGESPARTRARIEAADVKLREASARLSRLVLSPVAAHIGDKRLVIVADGALQLIPFGALALPNADRALITTNEVVTLPSIAVLAELRRAGARAPKASKSVIVFADPVFEKDDPRVGQAIQRKSEALIQTVPDLQSQEVTTGLVRLLASREEAKAIVSLAPRDTSFSALDFDASRERATDPVTGQYRIVHFATHGLLNTTRPELSGVVLSLYDAKGKSRDGFLRLNEIYNLRLSSELVVLSACSTALGREIRGEGLIGLTRGFMYAGAPQVIASLWKVDDEATTELMKLFYRNLLQKQMPASAALSAAQTEMRGQSRWRSPYYWAAFTLQGDWR